MCLPSFGNTLLTNRRFLVIRHRVGNMNGKLRKYERERENEKESARGGVGRGLK